MFIILTYDVNKHRVSRVRKICLKYLTHRQKSVFEGMITDSKLQKLKRELESYIVKTEDSICIYKIESIKFASREEIGIITVEDNIL